jgi:nicotinate-nucleotide adenylyltransferase
VKLGFLGGTFDPVHIGHLILGETAREQLGLDSILFMPTGQPWRKSGRDITPAAHRVEMLRRAIADNPAFELSLLEVEREGPSYTVDTLQELISARPGSEVFLIIGEDSLLDLPHWKAPQRVVELATLAVAARGPDRVETGEMAGYVRERTVWLDMPLIDISATAVRERVRRGRSIRYLVPEAVRRYIGDNGLYRK